MHTIHYPTRSQVLGSSASATRVQSLESNGLQAHTYLRPGCTFDISLQDRLFTMLVEVTSSAFGADMTSYWKLRREQDYFHKLESFTLFVEGDDQIVGWTGYCVIEPDASSQILYIDSTGVVPRHQSGGVMKRIAADQWLPRAEEACERFSEVYLTARTESPVFYRLLRRLVGPEKIYPAAHDSLPANVLRCAEQLATWLGQRHLLQKESLLLRNAYAVVDALYGELPSTGEVQLDRLFREVLGPLDAYLLIAQVGGAP
ncbi:hypothetical protein D8B24_10875 [Verminephrobacter aporrectodeae subsp. tuberculatae]|uniref:GNAT family N-acetyltransferase n=1 Tax=Verminephrobacter aporrectodeae TaxID=1110389 RepID=UPI002243E372|nr:GNAT family N-acetyltransferase [Verminephrobacter aporrectodeae]MCW8207542.1 hypothetical protein [Verminephrobacter aporrectodeae subsp. tuberculatae]